MTDPSFTPSSFVDNSSFVNDIQRLSRENAALPAHLAASVAEITDDVSRYGEEICRLYARVEQLKQNKASLETLHASMRSLIPSVAPIRRLPSELLVSIFQHLTKGSWWGSSPFDHVVFAGLRTLASVCFRWYRLILDTPILWTRIYIEASFAKPPDVVAKALAMALKRSMETSLDVVVHDDRFHERDVLEEPLQLLAESSHRWRTATFHGSEMPEDILQRVPRLERLFIEASNPSLLSRWINAVKVADIPRLRHLSLVGSFDISTLPLENLQETTLEDANSSSLDILLPSVARITGQLSLSLAHDSIPNLTSVTSDVQRLSLGFESASSGETLDVLMSQMFASLTLPHLSALSLSTGQYPREILPWESTTAAAFLLCAARSGFAENLQALDIRQVILEAEQLSGLLAALPALTELSVADPGEDELQTCILGDELLTRLGVEGSSLVPHLHKLDYVSNLSFDERLFLDFLSSRAGRQPSGVKFQLRLAWFTKRLSFQESFMMLVTGPDFSLECKLRDLEESCEGILEVAYGMFSHPKQESPTP